MLEVIAYFVIPVLVILVVAYFYVEAQKRKIEEENKKAIVLRVAAIKNNFKADVERLVEKQILTIQGKERTYRIANNFFVFQPITINNIDYCEEILNSVISAMPTGSADSINFDLVEGQVSLFIDSLPAATSGHNVAFYRNELPELIKQLVDSQEDIFTAEYEDSNEESQICVSATAA